MDEKTFDEFIEKIKPEVVQYIAELQKQIEPEFRAEGMEDEDYPSMDLTLAINDEGTIWTIQTGDRSYSGAAYGLPYWGIATLTEDDSPEQVFRELVASLEDVIFS